MASHLELVRVASPPSIPLDMTADMRKFVGMMSRRKRGKMSKEIRELEENSKRIIENMRPQTIAQYHIKQWLDDNFIMGCARLEYTGKDTAKVMDTVGGVMYVEYKNGEVRECQK